jgi:hypothetical protein
MISLLMTILVGSLMSVFGNSLKSSGVEFFGRFDTQIGARAIWPGTGVRFAVINNEKETFDITIKFNECTGTCNYYVIAELNCAFFKKFQVNAAATTINFQTTLLLGIKQEYTFIKITESVNGDASGVMNIDHVSVDGASFLDTQTFESACPKPYKMMVVGDSITAAYGVDGTNPCGFSASTENVMESYATLVAKSVGATVSILPWSGKGVVRNYGDKNQMSAEPMPLFYNRTISTSPTSSDNYWNPSHFVPDVVLVMLGTNDYSTQPNPTDEQFISGLVSLLSVIQKDYPTAKIAAMCAPMRAGKQCANIEAATKAIGGAGASYIDIPPSTLSGAYGCDYHPSVTMQQNMANYVTPIVRTMLGI